MTRTDFKIIVDLTHVFHDVRQLTLVYIDSTKIWHIKQLQEHLIELFNIPEPFHLLSTGKTYLPPSEDVRILDQNDVVKVVPGTGLTESSEISKSYITTNATCNSASTNATLSESESDLINDSRLSTKSNVNNNTSFQNMQSPKIKRSFKSFNYDEYDNNEEKKSTSAYITNQTLYHSIVNTTENDTSSKQQEMESPTKLDTTASTIELNSSKKKRVRHRKKKFNSSSEQDSSTAKKPRVVSNVTVSSGKHIRFNAPDLDSDTSSIADQQEKNTIPRTPGIMKKTPMKSTLDNLLALRKTSTPLTFVPTKKQEKSINNTENNTTNNTTASTTSNTVTKKNSTINSVEQDDKSMEVDTNSTNVKVGDIVDFKILKMGEDYCPVVSNTITAEVVGISADAKSYDLRITNGKHEIQGPNGKFALPDDSNVTESEIMTYQREELLELQIIHS